MCGLEPDDSSGDARQLSSSLITSALPQGYCCRFRIHATKPIYNIILRFKCYAMTLSIGVHLLWGRGDWGIDKVSSAPSTRELRPVR
jgi:hypothetical protein